MKIDDRTATIERRGPARQADNRFRWEYLARVMDTEADLTQYGLEGWELISVVPIPHDPTNAVFHFKRRKN